MLVVYKKSTIFALLSRSMIQKLSEITIDPRNNRYLKSFYYTYNLVKVNLKTTIQ